ncbi:MAG: GNAT family N-acetyltransferase [Sulfobacillus thermotolerans]|nr:GNAT family N-acetyltransferase [Sulfobacillus thermotolerans]
MIIRPYQPGDDRALIDVWNRAAPYDGMTEERWRRKVLLDANFNPQGLLVAVQGAQIVGFVLAVVRRLPLYGQDLEPHNGWITAFGVDPHFRRQHIATALFSEAYEFFLRQGRSHVFFASYAPHYFVPGLDAVVYPEAQQFFQREGFRLLYTAAAMDKSLVTFRVDPDVRAVEKRLMEKGYTFQTLSTTTIWPLLRFVEQEFDPDWLRAVREGLSSGVPDSRIMIARGDAGDVAGFAMFGGYDDIGERFGPFGVAKDLRGTGLGKVLLYRTLERMQQGGHHTAWFLWTGEHEPAGHLYRRAGFSVTRRFHVLVKDVKGEKRA